jgi:hypothetical protein
MHVDPTLSWQANIDVSAPAPPHTGCGMDDMQEMTASYSLPDSCNASGKNQDFQKAQW